MIGRLTGILEYLGEDHILLDVNGVGYIVYCSERTLSTLPPCGEVVALYTELLVREDLLQLFGFSSLAEKEWHRLLMSVQGIGAKASMAVLGALGPEGIARAIALGDWNAVKAAKGLGTKTAQRVVNELKDKAPKIMAMSTPSITNAPGFTEAKQSLAGLAIHEKPITTESSLSQADAMSALSNLGYSPSEAAAAVAKALAKDPEANASTLIRSALKTLVPKDK